LKPVFQFVPWLGMSNIWTMLKFCVVVTEVNPEDEYLYCLFENENIAAWNFNVCHPRCVCVTR
jgi:hypothetical protein